MGPMKTKKAKFKCYIDGCLAKFFERSRLSQHLRSAHGARPYACSIDGCNIHFARLNELKLHERASHQSPATLKIKLFKCQFTGCAYFAYHKGILAHHEARTHGIEPSYLSHEAKSIQETQNETTSNGIRHEKTVDLAVSEADCTPPIKGFSFNHGLQDAFPDHQNGNHFRYQCSHQECGRNFKLWGSYRNHTLDIHKDAMDLSSEYSDDQDTSN